MPVVSLHGPPGSVPQWKVPECWERALTSSRMSISPFSGHWPGPSIQKAGQYPRPLDGLGCSMDAVTSSSPPAGAPTFAVVVWIRPDVHELPWPSAVMSRSPLPSRYTLLDELVMVSISPVPKLEPGPVSYIQFDGGALPKSTLKSSLNNVDHPAG